MNILQVFRNEFLHKLGTDHIAVDRNGVPIARASDRASIKKAAPDAAAYFSGPDFEAAAAVQPTEIPVEAPEPIVSETTPADVATVPPAPTPDDAPPDPNLPTTPYPGDLAADPMTIKPSDEQSQTTNQDGPTTEQPSQDNDHVEPGAEEFPEPAVAADDPAKLN